MWTFKRRAHHYLLSHLLPSSQLEWLALMQHHSAPTRLIDRTHSPYVAIFFAVQEVPLSESCSVWAINLRECYEHAIGQIRMISDQFSRLESHESIIEDNMFEGAVLSNAARIVIPLEPSRMNERLSVQRGVFLAPGDVRASIEENIQAMAQEDSQNMIAKITFPACIRSEVLSELMRMNISSASLYPCLDGFAAYISEILASVEPAERTITHIREGRYTTHLRFR